MHFMFCSGCLFVGTPHWSIVWSAAQTISGMKIYCDLTLNLEVFERSVTFYYIISHQTFYLLHQSRFTVGKLEAAQCATSVFQEAN
jgi:hypothetical protein